jgi:hypothetical protein
VVSAAHNHATLPALRALGNAPKSRGMRKPTKPKMWIAYRLAKVGKRLSAVYGATEKEALAKAYKEFDAKTQAERKRIILRSE